MRQISLLHSIILGIGILCSDASLIGGQNINDPRAEIVDVTFCDLVREPSKYDGKIVRVNAILSAFHHAFLYDPDCNSRDYYIHPRLDCDSEESCKKLRDLLDKNSSLYITGSRTSIVAVGTFRGPGVSNRGYGNGSAFHFELNIKKIEKASPTLPNTPGPQ